MNGVMMLWKKRIIYLTKLYYRFIAFQFDAVILLYTLALVIMVGYNYYPLVKHILGHMTIEPYRSLILFLTVAVLLSGKHHGYLKAADEVFLTPLNSLGARFVKYSSILSILMGISVWSLYLFILTLVSGNNIELLFGSIAILWLVGVVLKLINMNIKYIILHLQGLWSRRIMAVLLRMVIWPTAFYLIRQNPQGINSIVLGLLVGFLALTFFIKGRVTPQWCRWISEEVNGRARNMAFLLKEGVKEKNTFRRKVPAAFSGRKLEPFDHRGGVLMLYYRILVRGKGNLSLILLILSVMIAILFFIDEGKFIGILILFFVFLIGDLLFSIWYHLKDNVWLKLYPISIKDKHWGMKFGPMYALFAVVGVLSIFKIIFNVTILHPLLDIVFMVIWAWLVCEFKGMLLQMKFSLK